MEPPSSCPSIDSLRALLAGDVPPEAELDLQAHLDACPRCRQRLEASAGGTRWLPDSKDWSPQDQPPIGPDLRRALSEVLSSRVGSTPTPPPAGRDESLDFLTPAAAPGYIGHFGPYDVIEFVGRGGMGVVLKAYDLLLNRVVAIKVLAPELAAVDSARKRFVREARSAAAVSHDHLVTVYTVDEANRLPYISMEYVDGPSLQQMIDATGAMDIGETVRIGMQVAIGLAAAHARGLIHRDIKPGNVLLDNATRRAKITDFGLAKAAADISITQSGTIAGTPQYMSPEQAAGGPVDHRADLFSLGSLLYAMCTGHPPFGGDTTLAVLRRLCDETPMPMREINPNVPDWLAEIVARLLEKDPDRRFQTAAEVAELLRQHLPPSADSSASPQPQPITSRRAKRRWLVAAAAAVLLLGLVAWTELSGITNLRRFFTARPPAVEAPQPPPAQPAPLPDKSFVVYGKSGPPQVFPTPTAAVAAAAAGDTIEIRWDGPIASRPILVTKPLTIRAARGYEPIFVMEPPTGPRFNAEAPLVLEGIGFVLSGQVTQGPRKASPRRRGKAVGIVTARSSPLYIANCRFVTHKSTGQPGGVNCIVSLTSPVCEIRNCLFLGSGSPAVGWRCAAGGRLRIRNCASADFTLLGARTTSPPPASLWLTRNTFYGKDAIYLTHLGDRKGKLLDVRASANVFKVKSVIACAQPLPDEFGRIIGWVGDRNLFAAREALVVLSSTDGGSRGARKPVVKSLAEWNALWKQPDSGSREAPATFTSKISEKAHSGPHQLTAADFRLQDSSAGADVDVLGPGAPYDRWRKTAEYQEWRGAIRRGAAASE